MKQQTSPAIILRRINYGEADRIVTFLTPVGKVKALVKGVRRSKSKLAGGIELFSESTVTFLKTRGDLARVISTRLNIYWDGLVGDLPRMMFGYEAMKQLDAVIENEAERDYFELLKMTLGALSNPEIPLSGIEVWFSVRLLKLQGHEPNLKTDLQNQPLKLENMYTFSVEDMSFAPSPNGIFKPDHIKLLRLSLDHRPEFLKQVKGGEALSETMRPLMKQLLNL